MIENTPSAFAAAIAGNYGIECDLQISADGEAMVHHDDALGRLTEGSGRARRDDGRRAQARAVQGHRRPHDHARRIVRSGRPAAPPLVIEIKSRFDGDPRLAARAAEVLPAIAGRSPRCRSIPRQIAALRDARARRCRAAWSPSAATTIPNGSALPARSKRALAHLQHVLRTRPQFLAYRVKDLPASIPLVARTCSACRC